MASKSVAVPVRFDLLTLLLIGGVVFSAAWSIAAADWMPRLDLLSSTVLAGLLIGTLLATRRWRSVKTHLVALSYGAIFVTFVVLSQMPDPVYGWSWLDTVRQMLIRLGEHIYLWLEAVASGGVGKDNTIFLLFLTAIFWLIGFGAAWNTFRHRHLWRAVAPAGIALLINIYYYGGSNSLMPLLFFYLFCVLLYAARSFTLVQEERWHSTRIGYSPEIKRDFLQIGSRIAVVAVLFSAIAPAVLGEPQITQLWLGVSRPLRSVEESFNRLFSGLQPHGLPFTNPFGRTLALVGPRALSDEVVLEVKASEGRYWQAVSYDEYTSNGWQSSSTTREVMTPATLPIVLDYQQRVAFTQTVTSFFPNSSMIFAAPEPIAANRSVWVDKYPGDGNLQMSMWTSLDQLSSGDSYQVVSSLSRATVDTLRAAGTDYPAAIRERYLQLPASLPQRVRSQAKQIVGQAGAVSAYDQASALEAWLRLNITYNDQIAGPKAGEDGVDYVLFESRQGYCDYYASAMAVMARSLGIPARVATGYASGEYDPQRGVYQVHQFNAHTWVEVYFPKYGWIEFEPTASQPSIARPIAAVASTSLDDPAHDPNSNDQAAQFRNRTPKDQEFDPSQGAASPVNTSQSSPGLDQTLWLLIMGGGGVLLLGIVIVTLMWLYENRGGTRRLRGGEWIFAHMTRMSMWLRVRLTSSQTPYEQAEALSVVMPRGEPMIGRAANLYVRERYGRSAADSVEVHSIWRDLRWPLWWTGFKRRLPHSLPSLRHLFRRRRTRP